VSVKAGRYSCSSNRQLQQLIRAATALEAAAAAAGSGLEAKHDSREQQAAASLIIRDISSVLHRTVVNRLGHVTAARTCRS